MARKVIVDCDPGVDDAMALLLLFGSMRKLKNTENAIEILGITITHGNLGRSEGVSQLGKNACRVLHLIEQCSNTEEEKQETRIPVVLGSNALLNGDEHDGAPFVHGDDGMGGRSAWIEFSEENIQSQDDVFSRLLQGTTASEWIIRTVSSHSNVSLITLGPLTNIALCLRNDKDFASRIKAVYTMGGVILSPGNISEVSEANIYNDPVAANEVFSSELTIYLAPLNLTHQLRFNRETLIHKLIEVNPMIGSFLLHVSKVYLDFALGNDQRKSSPVHDSSAVALMLFPEIFSEWKNIWIRVEHQSELTRGMTVCDLRVGNQNSRDIPRNVRWPRVVDNVAFIEKYIAAIKALAPLEGRVCSGTRRKLFFLCMGGSYNPIHTQHVALMETAKLALEQEYGEGCVLAGFLAVSTDAYVKHKVPDDSMKAAHRLAMANLAIRDYYWLVPTTETCISPYTFLERFGRHHGIEFVRVTGADRASVEKAREKSTSKAFYSVIIGRKGHTDRIRLEMGGKTTEEGIIFVDNELKDISSTIIRERLNLIHDTSDPEEKKRLMHELVEERFLHSSVANYLLQHENQLYF